MYYAAILRSPHAAAKIKSIDISKAAALKGVHAVFIGKDTENAGAVPCGASLPGLRVPHHNLLALDRVYLVGHPVAVVVATDRYIARDGCDLIEVDYEPTEAVADPESPRAGSPPVHPQWPDNTGFISPGRRRRRSAFAEADVIVKQRIVSQRLIPNSMETRGVVAD
jgi:carbon-monoxide dehydrogenase large subunit